MVALSLVGLWLHLRNLPQKPLVLFLIFLWFTEVGWGSVRVPGIDEGSASTDRAC